MLSPNTTYVVRWRDDDPFGQRGKTMWRQKEKMTNFEAKRGVSEKTNPVDILTLDFFYSFPSCERIDFYYLSPLLYGTLLWTP